MHERIYADDKVRIERDENGVPHIEAHDLLGAAWGLGYCHGFDRGMQTLLMRVLGRGELSLLDPSDASLEVDLFFRRCGWHDTAAEAAKLSPDARATVDAYCQGLNAAFTRRVPWELRLLGYRHTPWHAGDCLLVARMAGYLTLAQSQAELERLLVQLLQAGATRAMLEALFPGQLEGLDEALLRQTQLSETLVPAHLLFQAAAPRMVASNNWVVSGARTKSGKPLFANDPHLEVNRLPNVWYEAVQKAGERSVAGASMPGIAGIIVGRTRHLAWGATYTFMDAVDSWIERCRVEDGQLCYQTKNEWRPFRKRHEVIKRKGKPATEVTFFENEHGVLDAKEAKDGLFLSTRWSGAGTGAASVEALIAVTNADTVQAGMAAIGRVETAFNWVFADSAGNIGYQMSGLAPKRRAGVSGLVPLPGWDPSNDWQGFHAPEALPRCENPTSGVIVTANQDLNHLGQIHPISAPMGDWRARRIEALLDRKNLTLDDLAAVHQDVRSVQAERFMEVLRPLLPKTKEAETLAAWDCCYDTRSLGASLFESFYRALCRRVFAGALGEGAVGFLQSETGIIADFAGSFDRVLLAESSPWFAGKTRAELFSAAAAEALATPAEPWGNRQQLVLKHMLFGGKLPRALGFDRGPITLKGGRATPHQGQIYRSGGRDTSFAPSLRLLADLAEPTLRTALAGGSSDRRFSRWYCSELERWERGEYKTLSV